MTGVFGAEAAQIAFGRSRIQWVDAPPIAPERLSLEMLERAAQEAIRLAAQQCQHERLEVVPGYITRESELRCLACGAPIILGDWLTRIPSTGAPRPPSTLCRCSHAFAAHIGGQMCATCACYGFIAAAEVAPAQQRAPQILPAAKRIFFNEQ